jgi:hypothetical protein
MFGLSLVSPSHHSPGSYLANSKSGGESKLGRKYDASTIGKNKRVYSNSSSTSNAYAYNPNKYNPVDFVFKGEHEPMGDQIKSRFFVIKSYSAEDIVHSIRNNIWCSTEQGNFKLDQAFDAAQRNASNASVYLFFSVNGSGQFCGMAEMVSQVDYDSSSHIWTQDKWRGQFQVNWIFVKDVPNTKLVFIFAFLKKKF